MAVTAFTAQKQPTQNRDIVVGSDGLVTGRTRRTWADDRKFTGHPVNANVEKTAKKESKQKKRDEEKDVQETAPPYDLRGYVDYT